MHIAPIAAGVVELLESSPTDGEKPRGTRYLWNIQEIKILQQNYPLVGLAGCIPLLPKRTPSAIYNQANLRKLRSPFEVARKKGVPRRRWLSTPHLDDTIKRVYPTCTARSAVKRLADTLQRPRWWVSNRARALGLIQPRFKQPPWTKAEIDIMEQHSTASDLTISRRLKAAGFTRSQTAVSMKMRRLRLDRTDTDHYTAGALATCMGINPSTVTNWIEAGLLMTERRGTARKPQQGGDMWWIHRRAVRRFVVEHTHHVDLRKVDKEWFIDLVANGHR